MAVKYIFGGKTYTEPGIYSRMVSGYPQRFNPVATGNVIIIDDFHGLGWGSKSGIKGELAQGKASVFEFEDADTFKQFIGGGLYHDLADLLFSPSRNPQVNGVAKLIYVSAKETTAPIAEIGFGATLGANASFRFKSKDEGLAANGLIANASAKRLLRGWKVSLRRGVKDTNKFILDFSKGICPGVDLFSNAYPQWSEVAAYPAGTTIERTGFIFTRTAANPSGKSDPLVNHLTGGEWGIRTEDWIKYADGIPMSKIKSKVVLSSIEFVKFEEIYNWFNTSTEFKNLFQLVQHTGDLSKSCTSADLTLMQSNGEQLLSGVPFTGGTSVYNPADLDSTFEAIAEEDYTFVLGTGYDTTVKSVGNDKVFEHINSDECVYDKFLVVGGATNDADLDSISVDAAHYYNSEKAIVVHGGGFIPVQGGVSKQVSSIYHAALVLGRICGLPSQMPATWKDLNIVGLGELSLKQRERLLDNGVLHLKKISQDEWVINQAINSLQQNDNEVNSDGQSHEISIGRIKAELNKGIVQNALNVRDASGNRVFIGGNRATATETDVHLFAEGYLASRLARPEDGLDDLILSFRGINVTKTKQAWDIKYGFEPNGPVNKMFFTGTLLDNSINS